ncbi:MAG: HPr family phosphocarrier protein [candidate division KSB1 bacterium]|nr:HPr family phosphocarrier protein [candidate division KSB1 bacterium]
MITKSFVVKNQYGLHARPARMIVEEASKFRSAIYISKDGEEINAKSIMGILTLEARKNSELILRIEGEDEEEAMQALTEVMEKISLLEEQF